MCEWLTVWWWQWALRGSWDSPVHCWMEPGSVLGEGALGQELVYAVMKVEQFLFVAGTMSLGRSEAAIGLPGRWEQAQDVLEPWWWVSPGLKLCGPCG